MLADFRTLEDGLAMDADVCIVGAGAAGLTIAKLLSGSDLQVCLLESGGLEFDEKIQQLYAGTSTGLAWYDAHSRIRGEAMPGPELEISRLRYFGGSTNHWGGGCQQLGDLDFEARPWVPHSGWPIGHADLQPYYKRAWPLLQLSARPTGGDQYRDALPLNPDNFTYYRPGINLPKEPTRFGSVYRADIEKAGNIRALLHANLLEFHVDEAARRVTHASFRSLAGKAGTVRARSFILACGGIENARLLLLSDSVAKTGLGNGNDLVGRYFMDHPRGICGRIAMSDPDRMLPEAKIRLGEIHTAGPLERRDRILQGRVRLLDREDGTIPDGVVAVRELRQALSEGELPDHLGEVLLRIVSDIDDVATGTFRRLTGHQVITKHHFDAEFAFEQAPNPDSRVMLGDGIDALGQRQVRVDWRLTELDRRTYRMAALRFAEEMGRINFGRMKLAPWLDPEAEGVAPQVGGASHHMGTTRMADDPKQGVVDRNCQVHGMDNLFVAGSSCFPTSSWALPTWSIVAMAIRLADHLRRTLG